MSAPQRLLLLLLSLAVVAIFGVLAFMVVSDLGRRPVPTASPTPPVTATPRPSATPSAQPSPTSGFTPPPTKPAPEPLAPNGMIDWMGVGDLDGDGRLDLVTANVDEAALCIYAGDGSGWNGPPAGLRQLLRRPLPGRPTAYLCADLDGTGGTDLAIGLAGAPGNNGLLLLRGGAGWPTQYLIVRETPLALLAHSARGQRTLYVLSAGGVQGVALPASQPARLLPFFATPALAEGSQQPGAALLEPTPDEPALCFVGVKADGRLALAAYWPARAGNQPITYLETLQQTPRGLWKAPGPSAALLTWEGTQARRGELTAGGITWRDSLRLEPSTAWVWPMQLGPAQTPGLLTLSRDRFTLSWQPFAASAPPATTYAAPTPGDRILTLAIGDADGDGRADLILAVQSAAGEVYLATWTAAAQGG